MASDGAEPLHITISPRRAGNPQNISGGGVLESRVRLQFAPNLSEREFLTGIRECRLLVGSESAPGTCADPTLDLRVEFDYQVAAPFRSTATACISLPVWVQLAAACDGQMRFAPTLCRLDWARATPDRLGLAAGLTLVVEPSPSAAPAALPAADLQMEPGGPAIRHRRKWAD